MFRNAPKDNFKKMSLKRIWHIKSGMRRVINLLIYYSLPKLNFIISED